MRNWKSITYKLIKLENWMIKSILIDPTNVSRETGIGWVGKQIVDRFISKYIINYIKFK